MRNMNSRFLATLFIGVVVGSSAIASEEKLFFSKPVVTVFNFIESTETGASDYTKYLNIKGFYDSNRVHLEGCDLVRVKEYMDELIVKIPFRHKPPLTGQAIEQNEYKITEEIVNYKNANVTFVKFAKNSEVERIEFELSVIEERWVITNFSGSFERYIFKACSLKK